MFLTSDETTEFIKKDEDQKKREIEKKKNGERTFKKEC